MKHAHGKWIAASLLASLSLTGCGGGGGSSSTPSATSVGYDGPTAGVVMTDAASADAIVADSLVSAMDMNLSDLTSGIMGAMKSDTTDSSVPGLGGFTKKLLDSAFSAHNAATGGTEILAGYTDSYNYPCYYSGSLSYNESYSSYSQPTAGDSISMSANSCDDGMGYTWNGSVKFTLAAFTDYDNMKVKVTFNNFKQTSAYNTDYFLLNGAFTMVMSYNINTDVMGFAMTGDALLYEASVAGVTQNQALTQFSLVNTFDFSSTFSMTVDNDYTFYSQDIGGSIRVDTTTPIYFPGTSYPTSGIVVITGAEDAKVRLTAQPDSNLFIEYDINPIDGVYESSKSMTWTEFEAL